MKNLHRRHVLFGASVSIAPPAFAVPLPDTRAPFRVVNVAGNRLFLYQGKISVQLVVSDEGTVSVVKHASAVSGAQDGLFIASNASADGWVREDEKVVWRKGTREVVVSLKAGTITFLNSSRGYALVDSGGILTQPTDSKLSQKFKWLASGPMLGLGQFRDPFSDYRNHEIYLTHSNLDCVLPNLVSQKGLGLLWDTETHVHFASKGDQVSYTCEGSDLIRYHVFLGDGLDDVVRAYRQLTGRAGRLPKWAYGFWQSQLGWWKQSDLTGIIDQYRTRGLPLDVVVQDATYWGANEKWFPNWSGMTWDPQDFPNPKGMTAYAHAKNTRVIASIWPTIGTNTALYDDLEKEGLLFDAETWSGGRVLDISSPRARDIYWKHIEEGLVQNGIDGFWTDANEPEFMTASTRYLTAQNYAVIKKSAEGRPKDNLLTFAFQQNKLLFERSLIKSPLKRPVVLTRKIYAGQQAFNSILWSGDLLASWQTLYDQTRNVQQVALAGYPYWTNDIGAFFVLGRFPKGAKDPAYRELFIRWFQFSVFLPVFRSHGNEIPREIWAIADGDDEAYRALKSALELRYALMPYIYSLAHQVVTKHKSFIRPLIMDWPEDSTAQSKQSQFMFGDSLLVAPVTEPLFAAPEEPMDAIPNPCVRGLESNASTIEFYSGSHFDRFVTSLETDSLALGWFGELPQSLRKSPYSFRWRGRLIAPETGNFTFYLSVQGATSLQIAGKSRAKLSGPSAEALKAFDLSDPTKVPPNPEKAKVEVFLEKGRSYSFEVKQSQSVPGLVGFGLQWCTPSQREAQKVGNSKTVDVYLPAGTWYALGDPSVLQGPLSLKLRPKLNDILVFAKAGTVLVQSPGVQFSSDLPRALTIEIYDGQDGEAEIFDDEGDGYGEGATRTFKWDHKRRTLSVSELRGPQVGVHTVSECHLILFSAGKSEKRTISLPPVGPIAISFEKAGENG